MNSITLYTTPFCGFCIRAKRLLQSKGLEYKDIDVFRDRATRKKISEQTGHRTVPMIFIGDTFIGGCNELFQLEHEGKLDEMVHA